MEEEVRPDFPCPYCYEEFDVGSLCTHLEDDHPCESRATVCFPSLYHMFISIGKSKA